MNKLQKPSPAFVRFRETHHAVARMFATGATISKASRDTGYTRRRLHILLQDPSFQELIAEYAKTLGDKIEEAQDQFAEMAISNLIRAEAQLQEVLDQAEEEGEPRPVRELLAIVKDRADRFGYSSKRVVQHDISFAARLDSAIERSSKAKVIEHQPLSVAPPPDPPKKAPTMVDARLNETQPTQSSPASVASRVASPAQTLSSGFPKSGPSFVKVLRRGVPA
jgi:hypothetical protein